MRFGRQGCNRRSSEACSVRPPWIFVDGEPFWGSDRLQTLRPLSKVRETALRSLRSAFQPRADIGQASQHVRNGPAADTSHLGHDR
jgi:hypothetical protein